MHLARNLAGMAVGAVLIVDEQTILYRLGVVIFEISPKPYGIKTAIHFLSSRH